MYLALTTAILCGVFFLLCYKGTGSDRKNIKSYSSYPDEVQALIKDRPEFKDKIKKGNVYISFISNVIVFSVLFFLLGLIFKAEDFLHNFLNVLIMGEVLNLFDFLVIDLLWWRHSPRVRFSGTTDKKELYLSPKKHFYAFLRGAIAFLTVALIAGGILTLI